MRTGPNPPRSSLLLATLLVAAATLAPPTGPAAASADASISFGTPVKIPATAAHDAVLAAGGEPGIKVDSAGTIYYTHVCCLLPAETFYSTDDGKTFQTMTSPAGSRENSVGAEGDFAIDDADRVIFADTSIADIRLTRWRDHGATWDRTTDATQQNPINDRPWLGWGKGSLYLYTNGVTGQKVFQSYDEGLTWNPIEVGNFSQGIYTFTANRQDGGLWTVGPTLRTNVSADGGGSWVTRNVAEPERGKISPPFGTSIATDEAGNGYAAWSTYDEFGCDLYVAASTDHGQSWSEPVRVNAAPGCATFPWIDAGDPGHIVVVWYQTDARRSPNSAKILPDAPWRLHAAISTNFISEAPSFTEATLPNVAIDTGPLNRDVWDFFQVAIGPDGRFHIAYSEDTSGGCPEPVTSTYGSCKHAWYVGQAGGPLLHANRIAPASSVTVEQASASGETLTVAGSPTFKAASAQTLFSGTLPTLTGGSIQAVGPDSGELLFTLSTPPNGTPGLDGLPGTRYGWGFTVDGAPHSMCVTSREQNGPHFVMDGKGIGGTIDGFGGKAIARVPMSAIGAHAGSTIASTSVSAGAGAGCAAGAQSNQMVTNSAPYVVPSPSVTLSLRSDGVEVGSAQCLLSADTTGFTGSLDISSLSSGAYDLVTTACYGGDCASATTPITI